MIEIILTKGYVTLIDDCDADLTSFKWTACATDATHVYAFRHEYVKRKPTRISLHRVILGRVLERELQKHEMCDHIHGNTLDNRRSELRLCTPLENSRNQKTRSNNTSGFKGVSFDKRNQKFKSQIWLGNKPLYLGLFPTPEAAALAYNEAALKHFGEFARLNEISKQTNE